MDRSLRQLCAGEGADKFERAHHHLWPCVRTFEHQDHCRKAELERNLGDEGAYARYQRIGFEAASRFNIPLASRSSCTVFCHQPTFAPPGHRSLGRIGVTFSSRCRKIAKRLDIEL